jgi:protein gp37
MSKSTIEWTEHTWNPVTGCDKISPGCKNCYAEVLAKRLQKMKQPNYANGFKLTLQPSMLEIPLKRKKPTMWFVNSMSDLFHKDVPDEYIDRVFGMMTLTPQHTFQILTKRADRMRDYIARIVDAPDLVGMAAAYWVDFDEIPEYDQWLPKHIWLGVSVENQKAADERIPLLLETPAAIRFLSCEPLLGELKIKRWLKINWQCSGCNGYFAGGWKITCPDCGSKEYWCGSHKFNGRKVESHPNFPSQAGLGIDWVIAGGESGTKARPVHPDWVRSIRDQCDAAQVPFFFKQWGEYMPLGSVFDLSDGNQNAILTADEKKTIAVSITGKKAWETDGCDEIREGDEAARWYAMNRVGKKKAGRFLDGKEYMEFPKL